MSRRGAVRSERGVTAVEYALVIGLVSMLVIGGPIALGVNFGEFVGGLITRVTTLLP